MQILPTNQPIALTRAATHREPTVAEVSDQFETLLTHQILQELQKGLEGESLFGDGVEGNTLGAVAQWEIAEKLAGSLDLGILAQLRTAENTEQRGDK